MKKIITIIIILIVNTVILPQTTATIPELTLNPGIIDIPIQVSNFVNVGSITLKVQYDTTKLTWSGPFNWNSQISANAFAGVVNGIVSIAWASATAANISSGKLLDMRFNYIGGFSALTFLSVQCEVTDIDGNVIQVTYNNGSVSPLVQDPAIMVNPNNISFGNQPVNTNSAPQSYTLTGSNLTANVTVTAPTGYQFSTSSGGTYSTSLTITQSGGAVNQTIYVRFSPTAQQAYNGNVTNASTGATTQNVSVSGTGVVTGINVSPSSLSFSNQIVNTNSSPQSYTLTGSNLTANVTVTAPTGYQLSTSSGGTYSTSLTITQSGGSVNQTIYVRFSPTAQQAYNGNVTNSSTGATTQNVSVSGTGIQQNTPAISVNPSALNFGNVTVNTNSIPKNYTVSGSNLTTSIIITAPSGFLLSFSSTGVYVNSLTLLQSSGNVPPTLIYVRFSPTLVQQYVGNISHSSTGALPQTVSVSGNSVPVTLPTIQISSPNGGEEWQVERAYNITWESNSVSNVKIEYTTNNGSNWIFITNTVSNPKGAVEEHYKESSRSGGVKNEKLNNSFNWIVPNTLSNQCKIRITDVNNNSINDISDGLFSIVPNHGVKYEENFNSGNNTPDGIASRGWVFVNVDSGGTTTCFTGFPLMFPAFEGPDYGYIAQMYSCANEYYINQWLMSPVVNVNAGDTLSFWWRCPPSNMADSVIVHLSPSAGTTPASYTVVLKEKTQVPNAWTNVRVQFPSAGSVRFAFQYLIYDGGSYGNQSNYWGLDLVQVMEGPPSPPATPSNLTATTVDSSRITIVWDDNSSNEAGFIIQRRTNDLGWALLVTTGPNVNTYHDMGLTPLTTYYYRIYAFNSGGVSGFSNEASAITSIKDLNLISGTPESYSLFQNYPNPFNPTSTIRFGLVEQSIVSLKIYNITGQEVLSLLFDEVLRPGYYDYSINAENLPSGVYLYSFIALSTQSDKVFRATKKIILLK